MATKATSVEFQFGAENEPEIPNLVVTCGYQKLNAISIKFDNHFDNS